MRIRSLFRDSGIYAAGDILAKGLGLLLLPVYTAFLTPADYGIVAIAGVLASSYVVLMGLGLPGAAVRFFYQFQDEEERRSFYWTLFVGHVAAMGAVLVLLELVGQPLLNRLLPDVPYSPYLRLALLGAFLAAAGTEIPRQIFKAMGRAVPYSAVGLGLFVASAAFSIWLIVGLRQGALGALRGQVLGAALVAPFVTAWLFRYVRFRFRLGLLLSALAYGMPLIPHFLSHWVLNASDRLLLGAMMPVASVGIYNVGYAIGSVLSMAALAGNNALIPIFGGLADGSHPRERARRLVSYYLLAVTTLGLCLALFAREVIMVLTPESFHAAWLVVPWVVLGYLFVALYYPAINVVTLVLGRSRLVGGATMGAAAVNVALNLVLIPRFGIIGAAIATAAAYASLAVFISMMARRAYPLRLEKRRIAALLLSGLAAFGLGTWLAPAPILSSLLVKTAALGVFPLLLLLTGFWEADERARILGFVGRIAKWRMA